MIAIRNARLIDGTGAKPADDAVVLIDDNKIAAVGRQEAVHVPPDAEVLDAAGKTVLPGLIDAHVHIMSTEFDIQRRLTTPLSLTF
jgi:imidazolonepropionase-like amidohydrolase